MLMKIQFLWVPVRVFLEIVTEVPEDRYIFIFTVNQPKESSPFSDGMTLPYCFEESETLCQVAWRGAGFQKAWTSQ